MCGRYSIHTDPKRLEFSFTTKNPLANFQPRWNAAPTQILPVVRFNPETRERSLDLLRWGLVPHWAKDLSIGHKLINARAEGIETKASFRQAFWKRRCLVPADLFYEWKREGARKQPYAVALKSRETMALAGLWENWRDPSSGEWVRTFTIITTAANPLLAPLHDRMPVILEEADWPTWLGETADHRDPLGLLHPYPSDRMRIWPVSDRVNNVRIDESCLIEPLTPA